MGGDPVADSIAIDFKYFNPLRPCGRRHCGLYIRSRLSIYFNPLRPCGRRLAQFSNFRQWLTFQSTPPVWAETLSGRPARHREHISIHSARVGGDVIGDVRTVMAVLFQSTPPVWAETPRHSYTRPLVKISIHSARVGGDAASTSECSLLFYFNPLRPCGRRPQKKPVFLSLKHLHYNIFYRKKQENPI